MPAMAGAPCTSSAPRRCWCWRAFCGVRCPRVIRLRDSPIRSFFNLWLIFFGAFLSSVKLPLPALCFSAHLARDFATLNWPGVMD